MNFFNRPSGTGIILPIAVLLFLTVTGALVFSAHRHLPAVPGIPSGLTVKMDSVSFLNDRARDITGATAVNAPGFIVPGGLTGEGQMVAIADSGLDSGRLDDLHPDLRSTPGKMPKVVMLKSWADREAPDDPDGHGTHMAATIAGTGAASNGKFRGVAPGASIYFQAILNKEGKPAPPADLADLFWPAYSAGARVHVNGWGGGPNTYLGPANQIDGFVRRYPDFLPIFGAGNSGPSANMLTTEANSKNALTVGASILPRPALAPGPGDTTATAEFSSRGPAGDGRIKPELLAPGTSVVSARSRLAEGNLPGYPEYTRMQGTSMAAAVAGGAAALLREYFKKHLDLSTPSAALVKAALINGSRTGPGGPSGSGFGVMDLSGTTIALKEGIFQLQDEWFGVSQGGKNEYTFLVADTTYSFKATLAWTDPPAAPGSASTLVNDLDLVVSTPDGKVYYGNHFLGNNSPDRTNNVEQVYLPVTVPGEYKVAVSGTAVRRNAVGGSGVPAQDFALVWGQIPLGGMVVKADGRSVTLGDGSSFSTADTPVVSLVNDSVAGADAAHLLPGAAVYRTPQRSYLAARLWRAAGVRTIKTEEGVVFSEINQTARLGGYSLAEDAGGVMLNNAPFLPEDLPPGVEVSAVVNPLDQKIRNVRATYLEREGVVLAVRYENDRQNIHLAGDRGVYRVSPEAAYYYEDSYAGADMADMPFGAGSLEELEQVMPGMYVRLRLAPSSGEVQYVAVKRRVALGTVRDTVVSSGEVRLENGDTYRLFPGAPVKRDRKDAGFGAIKPGDRLAAVLLPDTGEAIGLVAYSSVLYGKVIEYSGKNRTIYLMDDNGNYRSYYLPPGAVIYRWGLRASPDAVAAGCRVRITTDPGGKEAWRLDLTDTLYSKGILAECNAEAGFFTTREGGRYRLAGSTRFYKNGFPVPPEEMLAGEVVEIEYNAAPAPAGNVLVSLNARPAALPPQLLASAVPLQERMLVTGRTGADVTVYVWEKGGFRRLVPVDDAGRFIYIPPQDSQGYVFTLVAVDRRTGAVAGRRIDAAASGQRGRYEAAVLEAVSGATARARADVLPGRPKTDHWPAVYLTRAEAASALARLLNWPKASDWPLPFADARDVPSPAGPAVAEARARGIFKGYPDGRFLPMAHLTRAEAAVVFDGVLRDLGLEVKPTAALPYGDSADIPQWAAPAVARATAAGLFPGRQGGEFAPGDLVTAGEMATVLNRLLKYCKMRYAESLVN